MFRCRSSIQQDTWHARPLSSIYFNISQANLTLNRQTLKVEVLYPGNFNVHYLDPALVFYPCKSILLKKLTIHHILRCRSSIQQDCCMQNLYPAFILLSRRPILHWREISLKWSLVSKKIVRCMDPALVSYPWKSILRKKIINNSPHPEIQVFHPARLLHAEPLSSIHFNLSYTKQTKAWLSSKWRSCIQENVNVHFLDPAWVSKPSSGQDGLHYTSWGAGLPSNKTLNMQDLYPGFISISRKPILHWTDKSIKCRSCVQENLNVHYLDPGLASYPC